MAKTEEEKKENRRVCKEIIDNALTENRKILKGVPNTKKKIAREISDTGFTSSYM